MPLIGCVEGPNRQAGPESSHPLRTATPAADLDPEIRAGFGRLVGDWYIEQWRRSAPGEWIRLPGRMRWTWEWTLGGYAIQDYWWSETDPRSPGRHAQAGTNLRTYDPEATTWHVVWVASDEPVPALYTAERVGNELIMVGDHDGERPSRIVYSDIEPDSFRWRLEFRNAEGWRAVSRIEAVRR